MLLTSYYQNRSLDPKRHCIFQISNGSPRWGVQPEIELPDLFPDLALVETAHAGELSETDFSRAYFRQLEEIGVGEIKRLLKRCERKAGKRIAVLCCFESLKKPGQFCHRRMLAFWYHERTGIAIPEFDATLATQPALL